MKKFTRRSYNRKMIVFALSIFMAVSLISVGFSAWVMSAVSNVDANAPVQVAIVKDAMLEVTLDQWTQNAEGAYEWDADEILSFDAIATDEDGRVIAEEGSAEKLTMNISGKVTNASILKGLKMTIKLPQELRAAIAANYIALDGATMNSDGEIVLGSTDAVDETAFTWGEVSAEGERTFAYTLTFKWGTYFGGKNPCEFYDSEIEGVRTDGTVVGNAVSNAQMRTEMNAFRAMMTNNSTATTETYTGSIQILVEASVN